MLRQPSRLRGGVRRTLRRTLHVCAIGVGLLLLAGSPVRAQADTIVLIPVRGTITPIIADHVTDVVAEAERSGARAVLIEMDTPGGLDTSMREIVQTLLNAEVPVIVYVAPQGARAASAGAIITMAAHVAAMAPGTSIGAATPIDLEQGDVAQKIINDAASYAESIAEERGRDVDFAVDAVREGRSVAASEAVEIGAVDLLADTRGDLLDAIDGRRVELADGRTVELSTSGATVVEEGLGLARSFLQWITDPNIAFLFISIGTLAVIYEFANPGIGAGAIVGAILLILAFAALAVLPVNWAGVTLVVLGIGLLVAELFVPGIGVLAAGGVVSLMLGGAFLFRGRVGVDPVVLLPTALVAGLGTVLLARVAWASRGRPSDAGAGYVIGRTGQVRALDGDRAQVFAAGSWWAARPVEPHATLAAGQRVRVVDMDGLELVVEPEPLEEREPEEET